MIFDFLVETYRTERVKTLSVWSQIDDARIGVRLEPRGRSPLEQMVHQCVSEEAWMRTMLGIDVGLPVLPAAETRRAFLHHYAECSAQRLAALERQTDDWFQADATFFGTTRTRAWILTRRLTHSAHHRGQLTAMLRAWGEPLYSTYGPTADTGGLPKDGAIVIYRYGSVEELLEHEEADGQGTPLPPAPARPVTERPQPR